MNFYLLSLLIVISWGQPSPPMLLAQAETAVDATSDAADAPVVEPAGTEDAAQAPTQDPEIQQNPPPGKKQEPDSLIGRLFQSGLLLPIGLIALYFLIFGPDRRRRADEAKMLASLKKNSRVVTVGGIHGTVVNTSAEGDIVTLKIDESSGTRIRVNRSAIAKVIESAEAKDSSTTDKPSTDPN